MKRILLIIGIMLITSSAYATIDRVCYVNIATQEVGEVRCYTQKNYDVMLENLQDGFTLEIVSVKNKSKKVVNDLEDAKHAEHLAYYNGNVTVMELSGITVSGITA